MAKLQRISVLNDLGNGISGTFMNDAFVQALQDVFDAEVASGNAPTVSVRSLIDNAMAGLPFTFGGSDTMGVSDVGYPVGSTPFDATNGNGIVAPNTRIFRVDSALLLEGTYCLEAMLGAQYFNVSPGTSQPAAPTAALGLFNVTDAPEVPMVELTAASYAGVLVRSGAITFPSPGATKDYAVKLKWASGSSGIAVRAWGIRLVRLT